MECRLVFKSASGCKIFSMLNVTTIRCSSELCKQVNGLFARVEIHNLIRSLRTNWRLCISTRSCRRVWRGSPNVSPHLSLNTNISFRRWIHSLTFPSQFFYHRSFQSEQTSLKEFQCSLTLCDAHFRITHSFQDLRWIKSLTIFRAKNVIFLEGSSAGLKDCREYPLK